MVMITNSFDKFPNEPTGLMYEQFGKIGLNPATAITFQDDFDYATQALADASWVSLDTAVNRVNITNDNLDVVLKTNNSDDTMAHDLGSSLSDSAWVCRFKWNITGLTRNNTSAWHGWIGLSSTNQTGEFDDSQDSMGLAILTQNTGGNAMFWYASGSSAGAVNEQSSQFDDDVPTGTYYIEIIRNTNVITVNVYTDSNYLNLFDGGSNTITGTVTGLQYFKVANKTGNYSGTITSTIDDLQIYSGVTSVESASPKVKQHFIEWFSGKQLPSYWTNNLSGSASHGMSDEVDGGFKMTCPNSTHGGLELNFNQIKQYNLASSTVIAVMKKTDLVTTGWLNVGCTDNVNIGSDASNNYSCKYHQSSSAYVIGRSGDGTTTTETTSTLGLMDTNFHSYKSESSGSQILYVMDSITEVTKTTNMPTGKGQPAMRVGMNTAHSGGSTAQIRYLEAYNT